MPIGVVSDDDFLKELSSYSSATPQPEQVPSTDSPSEDVPASQEPEVITPEVVIEDITRRGRSEGDVNVPDSLRQLIAEEQLLNGRPAALKLAAQFGISSSSVSAYANGATSTASYDQPKPAIINHLNKAREKATKRASKTLNAALGAITQDKLDYTDAKDLASIAKDMSAIIKNLEPKQVQSDDMSNTPQFVIFAPQFRDERSFETIHVKE